MAILGCVQCVGQYVKHFTGIVSLNSSLCLGLCNSLLTDTLAFSLSALQLILPTET